MHDIRLNLNPGASTIEVDGVDIVNAVMSVEVRADACHRPVMALEIASVQIEGQALVRLTEHARAALIELGWTPPEE